MTSTAFSPIRTERLLLRPARASDIDATGEIIDGEIEARLKFGV